MLLGSNFMELWYVMGLNSLYGIAAYIYCHVARYNYNGQNCADNQVYRANMLMAEVIIFWTTFLIMSVPQLFFLCMSKGNLDDALKD